MDFDYTKIGADTCIAKGPFRSMAKNVLTAIKESHSPKKKLSSPKPIMGIDTVYARQMTKELLSRNHHLETILESVVERILEIYAEKIVYANSAAISLFGLPQEKVLAAYPPDLFDKRVRSRVESLLKSKPGESFEIDPFFTTKEVDKGTGLGLSTTYGIIKSHEGEIDVDTNSNNGAVFKIQFPLTR